MLVKTFASAVLLALVAGAEARNRPMPFYKVARSPASAMLGLMRRDDGSSGYDPETEVCQGQGDTCAEACGTGYEECVSNHCYNPSAGDTCCASGSGDACESGHYCAHDAAKNTKCCDDKWTIDECSAKLGGNAILTEDSPKPTTAPTLSTTRLTTKTSTSSSSLTTTSTSTSTSTTTTTTEPEIVSTSSPILEQSSPSAVHASSSHASSSLYVPTANPTDSSTTASSPASSPTPSQIVAPGSASGNKAALVLAVGFFFALM